MSYECTGALSSQSGWLSNIIKYTRYILGNGAPEKDVIGQCFVNNPAEALCRIIGADKGVFLIFKDIVGGRVMLDRDYSSFYPENLEHLDSFDWLPEENIIYGPRSLYAEAAVDGRKDKCEAMDRFIEEKFRDKTRIHSYLWYPISVNNKIIGGAIFVNVEKRSFNDTDIQKIISLPEFMGVQVQLNNAFRLAARTMEGYMPYKRGHSERVRDICVRICKTIIEKKIPVDGMEYNLRTLRDVEIAAALHDIGKTGIRLGTIFQKPLHMGALLSEEERQEFRNYPRIGANMVLDLGRSIEEAIRYHHEYWNGGGYPDGLKGTSIPVIARIIGVANAFDSELVKYMYKEEDAFRKAVEGLRGMKEKALDPQIVDVMTVVYKEYLVEEMETESYRIFEKGLRYAGNGQKDQAVMCFEDAARNDSANIVLQMAVAKKMADMKENEKAIYYYSKALEICPSLIEAYYERGKVYESNDDIDEAGIDYGIAVAICPTFIEGHLRLGSLRHRREKYKLAIDSFDRAIELDKNNILAHYKKGKSIAAAELEEGKHDFEYGLKLLRKALYLYDSDFNARKAADRLCDPEARGLREEIVEEIQRINEIRFRQ